MRILLPLFFCLALSACGVKAPPVAPDHPPEAKILNLDCSVNDPECDKKDPHYIPSKAQ